jgi:hypothetical protein
MTNYPEWRKRACPHCAAGMPMSGREGYHWTGYRDPPKCQAPPAEEYIAALEARIAKYSLLLVDAAQSLKSYDLSYGGGRGSNDALEIAQALGFEDNTDELDEWLIQERSRLAHSYIQLRGIGTYAGVCIPPARTCDVVYRQARTEDVPPETIPVESATIKD